MPEAGAGQGRVWTYVRDERPWRGGAPPAAWYRFSADRKAEHPKAHLAGFGGWIHTDGYAGFGKLARAGPVREVACLAHVRRKFFDVHAAQGSAIAAEALERLAALYAIEKEARGQPSDRRVAIRGAKAGPGRASTIWSAGCKRSCPGSQQKPRWRRPSGMR